MSKQTKLLIAVVGLILLTACSSDDTKPNTDKVTPSPVVSDIPVAMSSPKVTPNTQISPTPILTASPTPTTPTITPSPRVVVGATRQSNTTCLAPPAVVASGEPAKVKAFPQLAAIPNVLAMVQPANDSSFWFLLNRDGRVYSFNNDPDVELSTQVLDISAQVSTNGEMGLTGIAFHPDFGDNENRLFLLYNDINNAGRSTISSFTVNEETKIVSANSEQVLLTLDQPIAFHNGGDIDFGIDGMLYASFGDSEMQGHAQNLNNLYGSLIRIDINTFPYSIPSDNPFTTGQANCSSFSESRVNDCPEIFAYGFRNPWRFSIDSSTGIPWVGDVGDSSYEEVDRVISGGNYGWPIMEGAHCIEASCDQTPFQLPVADYGRHLGRSVVGGYVYRGEEYPSLQGKYVFGDVYDGNVFTIAADAPLNSDETILMSSYGVVAMAQGNNGDIYQLQFFSEEDLETGFNVQKLVGGGGISFTMPDNLSGTGCFNTVTKQSAQGVFDYSINAALWSDGALKERSFALPDGENITVLPDGDFDFPTGSILIKHFLHQSNYLETRFLINYSTGWQGYSYEWNDAQSEATLLAQGKTKDIGDFIHTYPSRSECGSCHTRAANFSLGIETAQLNKEHPTLNSNTMDYLNSAGYFHQEISSNNAVKLYALTDESATIDQRARSYLHSNCSSCHQPGTANRSTMDLRYQTSFENTHTCNLTPQRLNGVGNSKLILPGNADNSTIMLRMKSSDPALTMPPIARLTEDEQATALLTTWINQMSTCP